MNKENKKGCDTVIGYDNLNNPIVKPKKVFHTMDEAIEACKILNSKPDRLQKVVSYKCSICCKYHIGRNGKSIKDKDRKYDNIKPVHKRKDNITNWDKANFTIIGKIDLNKIPKK